MYLQFSKEQKINKCTTKELKLMLHLICGEVLIVVCMCVITVLSYVHFTFVGVNLDSA